MQQAPPPMASQQPQQQQQLDNISKAKSLIPQLNQSLRNLFNVAATALNNSTASNGWELLIKLSDNSLMQLFTPLFRKQVELNIPRFDKAIEEVKKIYKRDFSTNPIF